MVIFARGVSAHTSRDATCASIETLELDRLYVVQVGIHRFPLADTITAVAASDVLLSPTAMAGLQGPLATVM